MTRSIYILLITTFLSISTYGQQCGFDLLEQPRPDYPMLYDRMDEIKTFPVVVHVVHNSSHPIGFASNVSYQDVIAMIDDLNANMASNLEGDVGFRFCLAEEDPNGLATTGITRQSWTPLYDQEGVGISGGPGETDLLMKQTFNWPIHQYYNVYVVSGINGVMSGGGITGYAYLPTTNIVDGTVIRWDMVSPSESTIIHELAGHAMGHLHTFQGNPACGTLEGDCTTEGDGVCDTPPHPVSWSCPQPGCAIAPCQNYMSYGPNRNHFTSDQIDKMHNIVQSHPVRIALMESDVCQYDGITGNTEVCDDPCPNDVCETAIELELCETTSFCNVNCNTESPYPIMPHPVSGVSCAGQVHKIDLWYYVDIPESAYYIMTIDTIGGGGFYTAYPQVIQFGYNQGIRFGFMLDGCDEKEFILAGTCLERPPKCFCPDPLWAGLCQDSPCADPIEFVPYWWDLTPPNFPIDLDPPPDIPPYDGNYDPTRQQWEILMPLFPGRYYIMLSSFSVACPEGLCHSYGGGNLTICQIPGPLSVKPVLSNEGTLLSWTGETATDWTLFKLDEVAYELQEDEIWNIVVKTYEKSYRVSEKGLYIVAGSTGWSNTRFVSLQKQEDTPVWQKVDPTGRTGITNGYYIKPE